MSDTNNKLVVSIGDQIYTLRLLPFNEDIAIQDYLTIDPSNIFAEMATMPLILNQIGNMRAELDHSLALGKQNLEILEAELGAAYKASALGGKLTIADVASKVIRDPSYQIAKREQIQLQRNRDVIDGFYWSAQAKINALSKMADKIAPEEFNIDIVEKSMNNVLIKKFSGRI